MIQSLYTEDAKIICPVRDIIEIFASNLVLIKKNKTKSYIDRMLEERDIDLSDENRCEFIFDGTDGGLKHQFLALEQCMNKEKRECFHLIEYNDLVDNPQEVLYDLYDFLNIGRYQHNYDSIKYEVKSRDAVYYGMPGLHDVRESISKTSVNPEDIVPPSIIKKESNLFHPMNLLELLKESTKWFAWLGLGLTVLTLTSFFLRWGIRFRLVGATVFTLIFFVANSTPMPFVKPSIPNLVIL